MASLLRKFGCIYSPSIRSHSLRQATLAWAAAFVASGPSAYDRVLNHSMSAGRALMNKTPETIDEADLFAAWLLCLLSCTYSNTEQFEIHLNGFMAMMKLLKKRNWSQGEYGELSKTGYHLSILLPLSRDMITEMSRWTAISNDLMIKFSYISHQLIGPVSSRQHAQYHNEFFGVDSLQCHAFSGSIWDHYTVLRRCFRDTLFRQIVGGKTSTFVQVLVSEINVDLLSQRGTVDQLYIQTQQPDQVPGSQDFPRFAMTLYDTCCLLILLLQAENVIEGAASPEAVVFATSILQLIEDRWLAPGSIDLLVGRSPRGLSTLILVRILCVTGLVLNSKTYPRGTLPPSIILILSLEANCLHAGTRWGRPIRQKAGKLLGGF